MKICIVGTDFSKWIERHDEANNHFSQFCKCAKVQVSLLI
jgi:hypothetical protein